MSNNSSNVSHIGNLITPRNTSLGLNLPSRQSVTVPSNLKSEVVIIPSTSTPSWGSYFIFDVKERNCIISDLLIQFNINTIGGVTGTATSYPHYSPATFFLQKVELVINNVTIDTLYPVQQFTAQQFFNDDNDRVYINNLQGSYNSIIQRNTLATATSNYYVKLRTIYNECHIPILSDSHNLQVRCYMETLTNVVQTGSGQTTGTLTGTINSANIICKVLKIPSEIASNRLNAMIKKPEQSFFHNLRYSPFVVNSGVSSSTIVLTPFVGNIASIFFVVRNSDKITKNDAYQFTAITSFAILDSTSSICVAGQVIPSALALQYLNNFYSKSSFTSETDIGCNLKGDAVDNKANVYCWSFSSNPVLALEKGLLLGHKKFTGSEQLQVTFTGALSATNQIDVWAYTQSAIEQGAGYVKVYAL